MAFPTGWGRRCAVVIDKTYVGAALSDFPVLCTVANLPSEMFDADGSYPARSDGGDIRFSSDQAGTTPLAREVVLFAIDNNPASGSAQIWVLVPSVSATVDTTIYVWYNAPSETEPAADSAYGSEAVWADYAAVYHCEEASGSLIDSAGNLDLTAAGTPTYGQTGKMGKGILLDQTASEYFSAGTAAVTAVPLTLSCWFKTKASVAQYQTQISVDNGSTANAFRISTSTGDGSVHAEARAGGEWNASFKYDVLASDTLFHFAGVFSSNTSRLVYYNGSAGTAGTTSMIPSGLSTTNVGRITGSSNTADGTMDEARIAKFAASAAWVAAEYNSANAPGTFASAGSPETPSGGTILPFLMRYYNA